MFCSEQMYLPAKSSLSADNKKLFLIFLFSFFLFSSPFSHFSLIFRFKFAGGYNCHERAQSQKQLASIHQLKLSRYDQVCCILTVVGFWPAAYLTGQICL